MIYFTVIDDRIVIRRLTVAVVVAAMSLLLARSLFIYRIRSLFAPIYFLITLFLANALFYGIRALETLLFGVPVDGALYQAKEAGRNCVVAELAVARIPE